MNEIFDTLKAMNIAIGESNWAGRSYAREMIEREIMRLEAEITLKADAHCENKPLPEGIYGHVGVSELAFASKILERIKALI